MLNTSPDRVPGPAAVGEKAPGIDAFKRSPAEGHTGCALRLSDPVVLQPSGIVGRIVGHSPCAPGRCAHDTDTPAVAPPRMVIRTPFLDVHVPVAETTRWRPVASRATALAIMRCVAGARPIPGWTLADGITRGWTLPGAGATHDFWVDSGDGHDVLVGDVTLNACGLAALATLIDWAIEAAACAEIDGLWLGRLEDWRATLLGELALSLNLVHVPLLERLVAMRRDVPVTDRVALTATAPCVDVPLARRDWSFRGAVRLGELLCPGHFVITDNGWHIVGMCHDIDAPLHIRATAGSWEVVAFNDEPPRQVAHSEAAREVWRATSGRPWIVLAARGRPLLAPSPIPSHADTAALDGLASRIEAWTDDPLDGLQLWVTGADGVPEALACVGRIDMRGDGVALLAGGSLTAPMARALRHVGTSWFEGVSLWSWGVLHSGQALATIPVFAGGPAHARTYVAFPAPFE